MQRITRLEVYNILNHQGMLPLFYHNDETTAIKIMTACYEGGCRIIEFTNRGAFAHEIFGALSKFAKNNLKGMAIGAGSIPDEATASLFIQLGADFIVAPNLNEQIAPICNRRKIAFIPGCGSLSEISRAEELGCEIVKLFPGSVYGPAFIKAIKGPQPWTSIMPTGGVSPEEENLKSWLEAGAFCVGMGSQLISKEIIATENYTKLSSDVAITLSLIQKIKNNAR